MKIPLVDLGAQYRALKTDIDKAIGRVIEKTAFILGPEVEEFERDFAGFCEAKYAVGVSSGTDALHLALLACGVGPGDEVITTPFTFIATAEAISMCGATPVFVDIDPDTYNLDPSRIESRLTSRTRAILPVHLYGQPADMDAISRIARKHNLRVIEDAAQAHGSRYKGRRVGTLGDAACFSFYPGKNLGAYGDGGAVVTNDGEIEAAVRMLRDHGRKDKYVHLVKAYGNRLDGLQGAIIHAKLPHLEAWNQKRRKIAELYSGSLEDVGLALPAVPEWIEPVWHLFVVRAKERVQLQTGLRQSGVASGVHYPIPVHLQPSYADLKYGAGDFPHAEKAATEVLSLPIYPELTEDQVAYIVRCIKENVCR